jgi:hypothetical protein
MVYLNSKDDVNGITLLDSNANMVALKPDGVVINDASSNVIELKDGVLQIIANADCVINAGSNVKVTANKVTIDSGEVEVGTGADSPFVRHTEWEAYEKAHTHSTAFGPSGAPIVPPDPSIASTTSKVK